MESADFTAMALDTGAPLQQQLYQQLVDWICSGRLPAGCKLLSSRRLAQDVGVSRNTVILVLEQLKAEGFIRAVAGKGVYINERLPDYTEMADVHDRAPDSESLPSLSEFGQSLAARPRIASASLPFTPGIPDVSAFPGKIWASLSRRHQDRAVLMGFSDEQGYLPLREALATYLRLSRGVRCDADQIIITDGAQQAISLCAQLALNPGDRALVENPGYRRARQAFLARGAVLQGCDLLNNYLDVDALQTVSADARILYTTPTHQYPLGGIMPAADRLRLLQWAAQTSTWILEDDYDSEFCFQQKPVAALQGMTANAPVLYMGSFSKTLFPSLRIGYLVVPKDTVGAFVQAKNYISGESCLMTQATIADFINEGHFVRHLRRMRLNYQEKWQHFYGLISDKLSSKARLVGQGAGMHVVIETEADDLKLCRKLARAGFGSSALSEYSLESSVHRGLVLGFANSTVEQRHAVVNYLASEL